MFGLPWPEGPKEPGMWAAALGWGTEPGPHVWVDAE